MRVVVLAVVTAAIALLSTSRPARAERYAVLPVDAQRDGSAIPVEAATAVRAALVAQKLDVLDVDATKHFIVEQLSQGGTPVLTYKAQIESADAAVVALNSDRSLTILQAVINDMKKDPDFSTEKQQLLEGARLKLAARLVAGAGPKETGRAETDAGKQARELLVDAIRANPKLAPSNDEYSAKFLAIVASARGQIAEGGSGGLIVDSRPQGATVFLEGRDIGKTPLNLGKDVGLAAGKYRLWVESSGARSVPQFVDIGEQPTSINIDLAFEGALWAEGPGLRPLNGSSIDEEVAKKIGRFLGVDDLVLVGKSYDDQSQWLWIASFSVKEGATSQRGSINLNGDMTVVKASQKLADFVGHGDTSGVERKPLPPSVFPEKPSTVSSSSSPSLSVSTSQVVDDIPWLGIGIGAGAIVVVATAVAVGSVLLATTPADQYVVTAQGIDAPRVKR